MRRVTLRALITHARGMKLTAEVDGEGAVRPLVVRVMEMPWARDLGPDSRRLAERLLLSGGDRANHLHHLEGLLEDR